jgi:hypothetical protein
VRVSLSPPHRRRGSTLYLPATTCRAAPRVVFLERRLDDARAQVDALRGHTGDAINLGSTCTADHAGEYVRSTSYAVTVRRSA